MRTCLVAVLALSFVAVACSAGGGSGGNNNVTICDNDTDCPPGYGCSQNVCVEQGDGGPGGDGGGGDPDIVVDPSSLDFGNPLLGVAVVQTLTINNVGGGDLEIYAVLLEEDGDLDEFTSVPVGSLNQVIPPGGDFTIDVSLTNVDDEADTGRLVIISNDPDEGTLQVALVSELKGEGDLATCVRQGADPFTPCVTAPEEIAFGDLQPGSMIGQDVTIWNNGTGNNPLTINDIYVTNAEGLVTQFDLAFFRLYEDPGNPGQFLEEPVTDFPTNARLLNIDEGLGNFEAFLVRVTFDTGALEGRAVPAEFLVVESDDQNNPIHQIPFVGNILCPAGQHDLDGLPGCEYACTITNGGVEACDGVDNDCDGVVDNGCPVCGNGILDPGEQCDDGAANSDTLPNACRINCMNPSCGDGVLDTGEACDDGNNIDGDGCQSNCSLPTCGDGNLDAGEQCDDGAANSDTTPDACRTNCMNPSCGDSVADTGEQCDDGALNSDTTPDACRTDCSNPGCGDGVVDSGESCDDGNQTAGDGCDANCQLEPCILSGTRSGLITLPMSPCIVQADTTVPAGQTLTVEAGVVFKFEVGRIWQANDRDLIVEGTLELNGTVANPITFTSYYDDTVAGDTNGDGSATTPGLGDWGRVRFQNAGTGTLSNVVMRYGGGGNSGSCCGANPPSDAILSINTSTLPTLTGLDIQLSQARGAIVSVVGGFPSTISSSIFSQNAGRGIEIAGGNALFTLDTITAAGNASDGIRIVTSGPITVTASDAQANADRGFYISTGQNVTMTGSSASANASYGLDLNAARSDSSLTGNNFFINTTQVRTVPAVAEEIIINNSIANTERGIVIRSGTVDINTTWPEPGYNYVFEGDVTVAAGSTLTIDPGVVIKSQVGRIWQENDRDLIVNGTLNAVGTALLPIYFTSLYDDTIGGDTNVDGVATLPGPGDWGRIRFNTNSSGSLGHVTVRYGGGGNAGSCCGANPPSDGSISISDSDAPTLDNLIVSSSQSRGAFLDVTGGFTTTITNSQFLGNSGDGIEIQHGLGPVVLTTIDANANATHGVEVNGGGNIDLDGVDTNANGANGIVLTAGGAVTIQNSSGTNHGAGVGIEVLNGNTASSVTNTASSGNDRVARVVPNLVETLQGVTNTLADTQRGLWIIAGTVGASRTWPAPGYEYVVEGDITVAGGVTLDVDPGAVFKMQIGRDWQSNDRDFIVNGTLNLNGTAVAPVVISSYYDDTAGGDTNLDGIATLPGLGDWGRIRFNSGSSGTLDYVEARYGGGGNSGSCCGANPPGDAILSIDTTATILNSIFRYSQSAGTHIYSGVGTLQNNSFLDNVTWGLRFALPIDCANWTQIGNTYSGNGSGTVGGC